MKLFIGMALIALIIFSANLLGSVIDISPDNVILYGLLGVIVGDKMRSA